MSKKLLFTITVVLLVIAFAVSAIMVGKYVIEGKKSEDRFAELAEQASAAATTEVPETTIGATEETTEPAETTEATEPGMIAGYEEIYNQNNDTVGWIKMEGTKLNYPVMQTPDDPNFYLYRDFDKKDSTRGSVYAWSEADVNEPSDNITIFGHNMADGSMFNCLGAYTSKTAWENNPLIMFDTLNEYHTYKIFAVFKTSANLGQGFSYHKFVDAASEQEFNDFVAECKRLSFYDTGITPVYGDKIISLSTCEYTLDNGRLVVCAVRIT